MNATILIVDDDPAISSLISHQLRVFGYRTVCLRDGMQALQQLAIMRPDLILLDVMMPHVSGWEVCRQIRALSDVPIIMLTAKDADEDVSAGLGAGADDYVTKPYRIAQLHARVEAALRRSARRRATTHPPVQTPVAPPVQASLASEMIGRRVTLEAPPARLGSTLREARQRMGVSLYQAEQACHVRWDYLQAIEMEEWQYMPPQRRRPAVTAYAAYLGVRLRNPRARTSRIDLVTSSLVAIMVVLVVAMVGIYFL